MSDIRARLTTLQMRVTCVTDCEFIDETAKNARDNRVTPSRDSGKLR